MAMESNRSWCARNPHKRSVGLVITSRCSHDAVTGDEMMFTTSEGGEDRSTTDIHCADARPCALRRLRPSVRVRIFPFSSTPSGDEIIYASKVA